MNPVQLLLPVSPAIWPLLADEHMTGQKHLNAAQQVAVAIVIRQDGDEQSVLAVRRATKDNCPAWVFPGGKINGGECPYAAAKREVKEETGVSCVKAARIGSRIHPISGATVHYIGLSYKRGVAQNCEPGKLDEVVWVKIHSARTMFGSSLYESVANYLAAVQIACKRQALKTERIGA